MIKTYNENGESRTKVFFAVENDRVTSVIIGNRSVPVEQGFQFYVDDYVAEQIDKCELYLDGLTPKLRLKEGEELEIPSEVEQKEREIRELEERLRQLKNAE